MTPPRLPSKFTFRGLLGQGGTASVFHVVDHNLGRDVALKLVGEAEAKWLRREFDTLRQVRHENLVQVFEWGTLDSGDSYYTMELVNGATLSGRIGSPLPYDAVLPLLSRVLCGLGHLHAHGEIHGDLKPSNVLLGAGGVVKISDVGMGAGRGSPSSTAHTPGYTAPEVWAGEPASVRADIYSVGVIAYEALTGHHPFDGRTIREVLSSQAEGWVPSPRVHGVSLPPEIDRAVMRALERDPTLRHGSADELAEGFGLASGVGTILGGRFGDRSSELDDVHRFVTRSDAGAPTLLYIVGPSGSGKSALIEEAEHRWGFAFRGLEHGLSESEVVREVTKPRLAATQERSERLSQMADTLIRRFSTESAIFVDDSSTRADALQHIARHVWAEATERNAPSTVRFISAVLTMPQSLGQFADCLTVSPMNRNGAGDVIRGLLGKVDPDPLFLDRLVSETGGLPGPMVVATIEFVDKQLIRRRFGQWDIGNITGADWAALGAGKSRRQQDWARLSDREKDVLTAIALLGSGTDTDQLKRVFAGVDVEGCIARLTAHALVRAVGARVALASRDVLKVIGDDQQSKRRQRVRTALLSLLGDRLSRSDRGMLLLEGEASAEAVAEGLWLGTHLEGTQQYDASIRVHTRVCEMARALDDKSAAREASLGAAKALHQSGLYMEATKLLREGVEWSEVASGERTQVLRAMLLGTLAKAQGDIAGAQSHFAECASLARLAEPRIWLQAEAELAELQWRHGGQAGREAAAQRVKSLSAQQASYPKFRDEWAALKYQLGASLVVEGKRDNAIPILCDALLLAESDYWLMRIYNALAAAHFYLGNIRAGVEAADAAWKYAVEGQFDSFKPRILASRATLRAGLGQFREAAEQNLMAAYWGRRMGSPFDYETGLLSAVADLSTLAEYERAIALARESRRVASEVQNGRDFSKSLELEGLVCLELGDYEEAMRLFNEARVSLEGRGFDDLAPRLLWHEGRVQMEQGCFHEAEGRFEDALRTLRETRDYEDLPGVQIELQVLFARSRDERLNLEELRSLLEDARTREHGVVRLRAAVAFAEIIVTTSDNPGQHLELLLDELRFAEAAGASEFVWRLSYWIARILHDGGDTRGGTARFANAVRTAREIASKLTTHHRATYLSTPHARLLFEAK